MGYKRGSFLGCKIEFVVGTVPSIDKDWSSGLKTGVFLDQVAHFLEFKDENEFMERSALGSQEGYPSANA